VVDVYLSCDPELRDHAVVAEVEKKLSNRVFSFREELSWLCGLSTGPLAMAALKVALRRVERDPNYQLPLFVMEGLVRGWTFLLTDHFSMSIGVRTSRADSPVALPAQRRLTSTLKIQPYPYDILLGILHAPSLEMQHMSVVPCTALGGEPSLNIGSRHSVQPGDTVFLRGGHDMSVSTLDGALVYVEITAPSTHRILPQFDPETHAFSGWVSGDPTASRLELLTRVIADFKHAEAVPQLIQLAGHEDHYVRWNTVRHLLRVDTAAGMQQLRVAVNDSHPDVRDAACRTMEMVHSIGLEV
jgi:hypothetical protein